MNRPESQSHLDNGDLLRLLADEMAGEERAAARAHVERCDACAARLEAHRHALETLGTALAALPAASPDPARRAESLAAVRQAAARRHVVRKPEPRRARWLTFAPLARAAVLAGVLVGGSAVLLTATPAGHWAAGLWGRITGTEPPATAQVDSVAARGLPTTGAVVTFRASGEELDVDVLRRQAGGSLRLRLADRQTVSTRVTGGDGQADVIVLPSSLTIDNTSRAPADYEVTVPAALERLRVRIAGDRVLDVRPASLDREWTFVLDLGPGGPGAGGNPM